MKLIAVLAIVAVIFGNRANATTPAGESENTNPGKITSIPNANSTTAKPANVSTTPKPTSNSTTNVSTTPKPTSNSTTNVSTTPKPTSNSTTNVSTTPKPTSNSTTNGSTTMKPTTAISTTIGSTTPKPITIKPTPPPSPGNFSLKENGSYCILAQFVAEFHITFEVNNTGGNLKKKTWSQTLGKHSNVTISGNCGPKSESTLVISWPKNESLYSLSLKFMNTSNSWSLSLFTFNVSVGKIPAFANATVKGEVESTYRGSQESSPHGQVGGNYLCNDAAAFAFNNTETHFEVNAIFTDFRVQPFANALKEDDFNKNVTAECKQDSPTTSTTRTPTTNKPSDVIPIAVGCALAGLVLIVLIAYVIGRRKSHSGYEKV
ncbi:PREDICTED: lysosome-associated membrane glycoprotein 1-like isoform X2 [Acropora digitifera]|uniref:lysosome-associated membrane glycoprotein 1-like isoform X2 n=1 Tax=Acropora digitifera TaxID=70779 RepID=UPI00077A7FFF|nr:PREDICTED: lysosome-associated membrane glycoprotein 1-like isoform X2 [Acropora digitifera]